MRRIGRHHQVATDHGVGLAGGDAGGSDSIGLACQGHVAHDRSALLGEPGLVHHRDRAAFHMGGDGDEVADGHHAGAADPRDKNPPGPCQGADFGSGQGLEMGGTFGPIGGARRLHGFAPEASFHGHQGRAKTV